MNFSECKEHSRPTTFEEALDLIRKDGDIAIFVSGSKLYVCTEPEIISYVFKHAKNICIKCNHCYSGKCPKYANGVLNLKHNKCAAFIRKSSTQFEPVFKCPDRIPVQNQRGNRSVAERMKLLEKLEFFYYARNDIGEFHMHGRKRGEAHI